ncbi:hypothetical protein ARMGADRAFT_732092 [Armillaria gallica]|uniref:Uncharacterized protein n=1 Tax=Armillaria gallica TaxID=47427 RepID=A0A2H3D2H0_ARMGA|nr:hypothetical protein ARMGADRAFT_732092 [Armillaria gallica]
MAEHFEHEHEVCLYVRSLFKDLFGYDSAVQYGTLHHTSCPPTSRPRRWQHSSMGTVARGPYPGHRLATVIMNVRYLQMMNTKVSLLLDILAHYPSASGTSSLSTSRVTVAYGMEAPTSITDRIEASGFPDPKANLGLRLAL